MDEAILCYEKSINLNSNHVKAYNNLGILSLNKGKISEAK